MAPDSDGDTTQTCDLPDCERSAPDPLSFCSTTCVNRMRQRRHEIDRATTTALAATEASEPDSALETR